MLKTASLIVFGIVVGVFGTLFLYHPQQAQITQGKAGADVASPEPVSRLDANSDGVNPSYEELLAENDELFDLVEEMESLLLDLQESKVDTRAGAQPRVPAFRTRDQTVTELLAAGFSQERAEWIDSRAAELHRRNVESMVSLDAYARSPEGLLRSELGDADFEGYLHAIGEDAGIRIGQVVDASPAAFSGLSRGDLIVTYDGHRVFDLRELIPLSVKREASVGVVVGIKRNDALMQLVIPGGPLDAELYSGEIYAAPSFVPGHLLQQ